MLFNHFISTYLLKLKRFPFAWWLSVLAVAMATGFIVTHSVASAQESAARYGNVTNVYVANHPLEPGSVISASDVSAQQRPRAFVPSSAVTSNPVGVVVDVPIDQGDVISAANTGVSGLSPTEALLRPGEQGIAVPTNEKSPDFQIGDDVSVFATVSDDQTSTTPTVLVTSNARVIHISDHAVTIAVANDDAPKVTFAVMKNEATVAIESPQH